MGEARWVLVAEDNEEIREMIADALRKESASYDLKVISAHDGAEAARIASRREFHCIITDLRMPHLSGEDLIKSLQSHALNANTPTLVISGHIDEEDGQSFANRFAHIRAFPKPFAPRDLATAVVRELRMGRKDERPAIIMMNPVIDAVRSLIEGDMGDSVQVLPPGLKKQGEGLVGDIHNTLLITTGHTRAYVTMSYDKQWLEYMKTSYFSSRSMNWATMTTEQLCKQVSQAAVERLLPHVRDLMGGTPRLGGISIVTYKNEKEYAELIRNTGISIVIRSTHGRVVVSAFAPPKIKRI
jgi:CheY-like chemotaxis protein